MALRPSPLAQAAALLLLAAIAGTATNLLRAKPLPWRQDWSQQVAAAAKELGVPVVTLDQARAIVQAQTHLLIDARPPAEFSAGHMPAAFNVPGDQIDQHISQVLPLLTPAQPILTYCSGQQCDESIKLTKHLRQNGFTNVVLFAGGWREWTTAKLPVEK